MNKLPGLYKVNVWIKVIFIQMVLLFAYDSAAYSQDNNNWVAGARAAAMSNAYVADSDLWSVHHNQAGLGFYPHFSLGFHHENKFAVQEFSMHALGLTIPVKPGTFGVSYTYFGYKVYNESKLGLGFGKKFGEKFSAGLQINLHHVYLEADYDGRNALSFEAGIQYKPINDLVLGVHVFNPTRSTISVNDMDTIPAIFRAGLRYKPMEKLVAAIETEQRSDFSIGLKTGLEYQLYESLYLRSGVSGKPYRLTFGIGYLMNKISADIAFTYHEILGFTPHFSFQMKFR
jgi:hypothetical protein